jgi:hypothetical protein
MGNVTNLSSAESFTSSLEASSPPKPATENKIIKGPWESKQAATAGSLALSHDLEIETNSANTSEINVDTQQAREVIAKKMLEIKANRTDYQDDPSYNTLQTLSSMGDEKLTTYVRAWPHILATEASQSTTKETGKSQDPVDSAQFKEASKTPETPEQQQQRQERVAKATTALSKKLGIPEASIDPEFSEIILRNINPDYKQTLDLPLDQIEQKLNTDMQSLDQRGVLEIYQNFIRRKTYNKALSQGLSDEQAQAQADMAAEKFKKSLPSEKTEETPEQQQQRKERTAKVSLILSEKLGIPAEKIDPDFCDAILKSIDPAEKDLADLTPQQIEEKLNGEMSELSQEIIIKTYQEYISKKTYDKGKEQGLSDAQANAQAQLAVEKFRNSLPKPSWKEKFLEDAFKSAFQLLGQEVMRIQLFPDVVGMIIKELAGGGR